MVQALTNHRPFWALNVRTNRRLCRVLGISILILGCAQRLPTDAEAALAIDAVNSYASASDWPARAEAIRSAIVDGSRIGGLSREGALNAKSFDRRVRGNHTVESFSFEAWPGFLVTGNLYQPVDMTSRHPAILLPHGHFRQNGYFARTKPDHQVLAATLSEMGAVVFAYDMVGWGDSTQLPHTTAQVLGLQLWDSIRSVDFLITLPTVDPTRIGVAGASGGGTQALLLGAVDERVSAIGIVVMLSAAFPGGDICEVGMPIRASTGTNNAEIAATLAPRPLLLVSDGKDWTRTVPRVELPYLQRVYAMLGAQDAVENVHLEAEGHDEGPSKRWALYKFFAKYMGLPEPSTEFAQTEPHGSLSLAGKLPTTKVSVPPPLRE
jgi:hypothetical protein